MLDDAPDPQGAPSSSTRHGDDVREAHGAAPNLADELAGRPRRGMVFLANALRSWSGVTVYTCMVVLAGIIAVDAAVIVRGVSRRDEPPAATPLNRFAGDLEPLIEAASAMPRAQDETTAPSEGDERDFVDEPTPSEPRDARRAGTVFQASARSCNTSSVDGLSRQIIAQSRCIDARAFVPVPQRQNLVTHSNVFLYLDASARDRLVQILDADKSRVMKVNSALRTVAQQYLLFRWASSKRCGIQLATPPGESNHETGLALDIAEPSKWRATLEAQDFVWLGTIDRVHFDFKGPGATAHNSIDVMAFQQLWNKNHPDDTIVETGRYSDATEQRLKKSPAAGFPTGPSCAKAPGGAGGGASRVLAR